ncbi:hypothetical protein [Kineococcus sp. SYSU DK018]|uniref:hypothetical protein n=1 Tax=Kineococcus sp. SYSU DK018 TaxID=3383139 RepID=UPI003D7C63F5
MERPDPLDPLVGGEAGGGVLAAVHALGGRDVPLREAADRAGVARDVAALAVQRLTRAGLLTQRRDDPAAGLGADTSNPCADAVADLLWVQHGVRRPRAAPARAGTAGASPFTIGDLDLKALVPRVLQLPDGHGAAVLPGEDAAGPDAREVRALVLRLERDADRLLGGRWLQRAHARWRDPRDRDLLELTGALGAGLRQAAHALRAVSAAPAGAVRGPERVGVLAWAHAVHCLDAEVTVALGVRHQVLLAVDHAREVAERREAVKDSLQRVLREHELGGEARAARHAGELAHRQELLERAKQAAGDLLGDGTGRADGVGAAGERMLAAHVHEVATTAAAHVHRMAAHPAWAAWCSRYPEVAADHPLTEAPTRSSWRAGAAAPAQG